MSCPKNIKEINLLVLRINYKGPHRYQLYLADWSGFLSSWDLYFSCEFCGARENRPFVKDQELINAGIEIPEDRRRLVESINEKRKLISND